MLEDHTGISSCDTLLMIFMVRVLSSFNRTLVWCCACFLIILTFAHVILNDTKILLFSHSLSHSFSELMTENADLLGKIPVESSQTPLCCQDSSCTAHGCCRHLGIQFELCDPMLKAFHLTQETPVISYVLSTPLPPPKG
jgi:hypothetical protein